LTNAADRLAAQQMLQRGGCHRRQGQAPGVPRIVAVPRRPGGATGCRCVPTTCVQFLPILARRPCRPKPRALAHSAAVVGSSWGWSFAAAPSPMPAFANKS